MVNFLKGFDRINESIYSTSIGEQLLVISSAVAIILGLENLENTQKSEILDLNNDGIYYGCTKEDFTTNINAINLLNPHLVPELPQYLIPKRSASSYTQEELIKMDVETIMSIDIDTRFELMTTKVSNGYRVISFPNKALESAIGLEDIIPREIQYLELVKNNQEKQDGKILRQNYFDIIKRNAQGGFESIFAGEKYESKPKIINGYIIKLGENSEKFNLSYQGSLLNPPHHANAYANEIIIRTLYSDLIKQLVYIKDPKSGDLTHETMYPGVTEDLIYSVIQQESKFDPNAISHSNTRGLMMLVQTTLGFIINHEISPIDMDDLMPVNNEVPEYKYYKQGDYYKFINSYTRPYNPETSLRAGIGYLRYLSTFFKKKRDSEFSKSLVIVSYNAGPGVPLNALKTNIADYGSAKSIYPSNWDQLKIALKILSRTTQEEESYKLLREIKSNQELTIDQEVELSRLSKLISYHKYKEIIGYHQKVTENKLLLAQLEKEEP